MAANTGWLFWLIGGAFGAAGLLLLAVSLFKDRARGRRRCPKCWYDMAGTRVMAQLTCSECGHTVKRERQLYKTRRRWRRAILACAILLMAVGVSLVPSVLNKTWPGLVPTDVLVLWARKLPQWSPMLQTELDRRIAAAELSARQWRWLINRLIDDPMGLVQIDLKSREKWPVDSEPRYTAEVQRFREGRLWFDGLPLIVSISPRSEKGEELEAVCNEFGRFSQCTLHRKGAMVQLWLVRSCATGVPPPDERSIAFDVVAEVEAPIGSRTARIEIGRRVIDLSLTQQGALEDHMQAVHSNPFEHWLSQSATCQANGRGVWLTVASGMAFPLEAPLTFGGRAELRRGDEVVATTDIIETQAFVKKWMTTSGETRLGGIWDDQQALRNVIVNSTETWSLRIRSDVHIAMDDFESNRYWAGELTLPLEYDSQRLEWRSAGKSALR